MSATKIVNLAELRRDAELFKATHSVVLDNDVQDCTVDFLRHIENQHILKQLSLSIAKATWMPAHTVFLMGLGIFSSVASRKWCVDYKKSGSKPIGLYVAAEQPSAMAKTYSISSFIKPFHQAETSVKASARELYDQYNRRLKRKEILEDIEEADYSRIEKLLSSRLFVTNSTPEAMEALLIHSDGFFSAVSTEQGLANSLLGLSYGADRVSNNDMVLNGFDGEYVSTSRVGRPGFSGNVCGSIVLLAQDGTINTLLSSSNGTGLSERFLFLAEPHSLGKRDFSNPSYICPELVEQYNAVCNQFAQEVIASPKELSDLLHLTISDDGWQAIYALKNYMEARIGDGGRYAYVALRGAAGKAELQAMKIAANLHLLEDQYSSVIADKHVYAATEIVTSMIEANYLLCKDKGLIGVKAEYLSVLSLYSKDQRPRTERNIISIKKDTEPFKNFTGNKSDLIRKTINDMVKDGILQEVYGAGDKPVRMYALAQ